MFCLYLLGTTLYSGSADTTVRVWDLLTLALVGELIGHEGSVRGISVRGDVIYSISSDCTVRLWSRSSLEALTTICAISPSPHSKSTQSAQSRPRPDAPGAATTTTTPVPADKRIGVIECRRGVRCVVAVGSLLCMGFSSGDIEVMETSNCVYVAQFNGHAGQAVLSLAAYRDRLYSSDADGVIKAWDIYAWTQVSE